MTLHCSQLGLSRDAGGEGLGGDAREQVAERLGARDVAVVELRDLELHASDEPVDRAVPMTASPPGAAGE